MIGADTNVLVRIFVDDDQKQRDAALAFMRARSDSDPAFVSIVVVVELCWALTRIYQFSSTTVREALDWLFESTNVVVEESDMLRSAIAFAAAQQADFSDCIIAAIAEKAGVAKTMTFDKNAAKRIPGMELLA